VTILVVIGAVVTAWVLLSVLGNERQARINRMLLEQHNRTRDKGGAPDAG